MIPKNTNRRESDRKRPLIPANGESEDMTIAPYGASALPRFVAMQTKEEQKGLFLISELLILFKIKGIMEALPTPERKPAISVRVEEVDIANRNMLTATIAQLNGSNFSLNIFSVFEKYVPAKTEPIHNVMMT